MDFALPEDLAAYLDELDRFIEAEIMPLQNSGDNMRFFDHRREWARTDFDKDGLPRPEWEALLREAKDRADRAGHLRLRCRGNSVAGTGRIYGWP
jgi:acyl-CoA dehydrogenase